MLSTCLLLDHDGVTLTDVRCRLPAGRGHTDATSHHGLVFVRRGAFVRSADGAGHLLDATQAYCINPGEEQRYDHPHGHGDDCTSVAVDPVLLASAWGGDPTLPATPLPSSPRVDLGHRLLLAAAHRGDPPDELHERTLALVAAALAQVDPDRVASGTGGPATQQARRALVEPARVAAGRPSTARAHRALVDAAREALAAAPDRSLAELAADLGVSPFHLSRVFRAATGHTVARHRLRLRVRAALERLAHGDHRLAHVAADVGFADQSHLTRAIRAETGRTPSALRRALAQ